MLSLTIAAPLLAMFYYLRRSGGQEQVSNRPAIIAILISLLGGSYAAATALSSGKVWSEGMLELDALAAFPLAIFALLALITLMASPKSDQNPDTIASVLAVSTGTFAAYASSDLRLFCVGWAITLIPSFLKRNSEQVGPRVIGIVSLLCLVAALVSGSGWPAFLLLALAALLRKGIFPFHFWVPNAFEKGSPLVWNLFLNGHLAALLLARFGLKQFPGPSQEALGLISAFALLTAMYTAFLAISEKSSRRLIALLSLSQASFILAGFESRNAEGITGATLHWIVVALATTGLTVAYRLLEARAPQAASFSGFLGLGGRMPRISVFFLVSGLALVGLPGTLGFVAEDLLFHGAIESHPLLGLALPVATAINAITILRVFSKLFLGQPAVSLPQVPDAKPMERWALSMCLGLLVFGGLFPQIAIHLRQPAADVVASLLSISHQ
ncbi:MAG: proton-conducting transporter membrane subunit [Acidobacteria bacterium]|nr:proton-conducting transporter membrane subunit [Acidobacteriota bacterium]